MTSRRISVAAFAGMPAALLLLAVAAPAQAQIAWDDAGDPAYADGWQNGDNGGYGFLPWALSYSGIAPDFHSDHFIDNAPLAANSLGAPAFGMTDSGRAFFFDTSGSTRPFASALGVGSTFEVDVDAAGFANGDPTGFSKGNTIAFRNSAGGERFGMFTNNQFANDNWVVTNPAGSGSSINTGIAAGSSFHLNLAITGAETYSLALSPIGGGAPLFSQSGTLRPATVGTLIDRVHFTDYGTGSAADGSSELFLNNLHITPEPTSFALLAMSGLAGCMFRRRR